jgi:hypothetical protein
VVEVTRESILEISKYIYMRNGKDQNSSSSRSEFITQKEATWKPESKGLFHYVDLVAPF